MDPITILGLVAGLLSTLAGLPQIIKIWRTKKTHDISLGMYIILSAGVFLWLIYGIITKDMPIVVANFVGLVLVLSLLALKLKYK